LDTIALDWRSSFVRASGSWAGDSVCLAQKGASAVAEAPAVAEVLADEFADKKRAEKAKMNGMGRNLIGGHPPER
jgi:hypothetical protein